MSIYVKENISHKISKKTFFIHPSVVACINETRHLYVILFIY